MIMVPPPLHNAPFSKLSDTQAWRGNSRDLQSATATRVLEDGSIGNHTASSRAGSAGSYLDYQRNLNLDVLPSYSSDLSRLLRMESMQRLQQSQRIAELGNMEHHRLTNQLSTPFPGQRPSQMPPQLSSQMSSQLSSQMSSQLSSQLASQRPSQLPNQIPGQLPSQLQGRLPPRLTSQLTTQLAGQLPSHQFSNQFNAHQLQGQMPGSGWMQNLLASQSMQSMNPSPLLQQQVARASAASMTGASLDMLRSAASQEAARMNPFARVDATGGAAGVDPHANLAKPKDGHYFIDDIREWDVLCGRGGRSNHHPGNKRYRQVVSEMKASYRNIEAKSAKTDLSRAIVEHVYNYGGRFVKVDKESGRFYVLTVAESRKKTSQALRETKELKWTL